MPKQPPVAFPQVGRQPPPEAAAPGGLRMETSALQPTTTTRLIEAPKVKGELSSELPSWNRPLVEEQLRGVTFCLTRTVLSLRKKSVASKPAVFKKGFDWLRHSISYEELKLQFGPMPKG